MKNYFFAMILLATMGFSSCRPAAVVVRERPAPPVYVRPVAPAPSYVWVEGGWISNRRGGYAYRQGYWATPRRNHSYRPGYWRQTRRGYVWVQGR
ncbi:hypothetical protein BH11BAC4_BH11BAC4_11910 [soil metagenome]